MSLYDITLQTITKSGQEPVNCDNQQMTFPQRRLRSKAFGGLNRRLKEKTAGSRWFETTGQAPFGRAKAAYWKINSSETLSRRVAMADAPYNILLMMTDQHRADHLSCYGNTVLSTPNLDRLATSGLRFERCYVVNPSCKPNRTTLLTGCLPSHHG